MILEAILTFKEFPINFHCCLLVRAAVAPAPVLAVLGVPAPIVVPDVPIVVPVGKVKVFEKPKRRANSVPEK